MKFGFHQFPFGLLNCRRTSFLRLIALSTENTYSANEGGGSNFCPDKQKSPVLVNRNTASIHLQNTRKIRKRTVIKKQKSKLSSLFNLFYQI